MISNEIDRSGIPVAQITTMTDIAQMVGVNRILTGNGIVHPLGDASLSKEDEYKLRLKLVSKAIDLLTQPGKSG